MKPTLAQKIELFHIAALMCEAGLSNQFIMRTLDLGVDCTKIYNLCKLWEAETNSFERKLTEDAISEEWLRQMHPIDSLLMGNNN